MIEWTLMGAALGALLVNKAWPLVALWLAAAALMLALNRVASYLVVLNGLGPMVRDVKRLLSSILPPSQ